MPATTPTRAIPYPIESDPVPSLWSTVKSLAERVEALLAGATMQQQRGKTGTLQVAAGSTDYSVLVTFPNPFPSPPGAVLVTLDSATLTGLRYSVNDVTATGFRLYYRRDGSAVNIGGAHWLAVL